MNAPGPAPAAADDEPAVQAYTRDRFVDVFLGQSRRAQVGTLAASALIALMWWGHGVGPEPLLWLSLVALVTGWRFFATDRFVRRAPPVQQPARIVAVLMLNALTMVLPLLQFDVFSEIERAAISIVLIALATGSIVTTSGYRRIFLAFAATMIVPLGVAWFVVRHQVRDDVAAMGLGALVLAFMAFLMSVAGQAREVFLDASRFRHGAERLNRQLQAALQEADDANRAKTQFLAAASHDLRQPIHSMNVLVAALTLRPLDTRSREIVALLDSVNQTLSRQLDGLLDISKLDAGTVKPQLEIERLDALAASHLAAALPAARERGLRLELAAAEPVSVLTDAALLMRVLSNLTDNAMKFTRRGGEVTIAVQRDGRDALLVVRDSGIGIDPAEHQRVFREFYQVGNVERDRSKGLGLGLSIVKRLCGLLGVALTLDSAPGRGTCITLRLPAVAHTEPPPVAAAPARVPPGLRVLVVDDEAVVRHSMRLLLGELGCAVHLADSTAAAVAVAHEHALDVVLSDFRLRDGDSGIGTLRAVQALHPTARAALVTGDTAPDRIQDALSAGVPLLHKPVTLDALVGVLQPAAH